MIKMIKMIKINKNKPQQMHDQYIKELIKHKREEIEKEFNKPIEEKEVLEAIKKYQEEEQSFEDNNNNSTKFYDNQQRIQNEINEITQKYQKKQKELFLAQRELQQLINYEEGLSKIKAQKFEIKHLLRKMFLVKLMIYQINFIYI